MNYMPGEDDEHDYPLANVLGSEAGKSSMSRYERIIIICVAIGLIAIYLIH